MPMVMASWLMQPSAPRRCGGATSAMYTGTFTLTTPTAMPVSTRAVSTWPTPLVVAPIHTHPAMKGRDAICRARLRPSRSDSTPPSSAPIMQPMFVMAPKKSPWSDVSHVPYDAVPGASVLYELHLKGEAMLALVFAFSIGSRDGPLKPSVQPNMKAPTPATQESTSARVALPFWRGSWSSTAMSASVEAMARSELFRGRREEPAKTKEWR